MEVARPATTDVNITQWLVPVASADKRGRLRDLLRQDEVRTAIIFCNRKTTVRELNKSLKRSGFQTGEIHGDMEQPRSEEHTSELQSLMRISYAVSCLKTKRT